jgi:hypothetical protein
MPKPTLASSGYRKYSQYGEDGILEAIFSRIGTTSKTCVEFGAWDGLHFANAANLWTNGWRGILIECDPEKFAALQRNTEGHDCLCIQAMVGHGPQDGLERLLERHGVRGSIDLLSIDIDGDDYYIFRSLEHLRPRVVVVEYNPTIPADVDLFADPGSYFGCSVGALVRLGRERGYGLVCLTDTNAFFVLESELPKLDEFDTSLPSIRIDKHLVHLATSFAGDYVLCGNPLFRLNFPYRGRLYGEHRRVHFKPRLLLLRRLPSKLWRHARALWS